MISLYSTGKLCFFQSISQWPDPHDGVPQVGCSQPNPENGPTLGGPTLDKGACRLLTSSHDNYD